MEGERGTTEVGDKKLCPKFNEQRENIPFSLTRHLSAEAIVSTFFVEEEARFLVLRGFKIGGVVFCACSKAMYSV